MEQSEYEPAKISLYEDIYAVIAEFDKVFLPPISDCVDDLKHYSEKLYKSAYLYKAEKDAVTAGFIAFYANNGEYAYITLIAVKDQYRKAGLGRSLLNKCLAVALEAGLLKVNLKVMKVNETAIAFYRKHGFYAIGCEDSCEQWLLLERKI